MRIRRHREPPEVLASLNITNLVDTAFILLITFMLVAPQLNHGIKLDLPKVAAPTLDDDPTKTVEISIAKKRPGEKSEWIYLDGKRVTLEDLFEKVKKEREAHPDLVVVVRGDRLSTFDTFTHVSDALLRAGVERISLPLQPEQVARKKPE